MHWPFQKRKPLRAGVLNTGELVLLDDTDRALVYSAETTDLIRDVLAADEQRAIDSTPLGSLFQPLSDLPEPQGAAHEFSRDA